MRCPLEVPPRPGHVGGRPSAHEASEARAEARLPGCGQLRRGLVRTAGPASVPAFACGLPQAALAEVCTCGAWRPPAVRPGLNALVPGCGRAYDALALAEHGYASVVALDVSPAACEAARAELHSSQSPAAGQVEVRCGDFFSLQGETFDLIWDCTFLCALNPSVRERWAAQMHALLSPQG